MNRLKTYASFVRVSHSVFALPFALTGALLALHRMGDWTAASIGWRLLWIVVAMVTARSAAMGFNRLVDARFDALNPRTASRELPRGAMTLVEATIFVVVSAVLFVFAAWKLGPLCFALSPVALVIVFWYSLAKRVTSYTQLFLGLAMAVAPVGGWLAAGGRGGWEPWLLGTAIGTWVGGFDVLYACQDLEFDRAHGLRSIPVRFGLRRALAISRAVHVLTVICLAALAAVTDLGWIYLAGVAGVAVLLAWEQSMVSEHDLSQVKRAFDLNGYVGVFYLVTTALGGVCGVKSQDSEETEITGSTRRNGDERRRTERPVAAAADCLRRARRDGVDSRNRNRKHSLDSYECLRFRSPRHDSRPQRRRRDGRRLQRLDSLRASSFASFLRVEPVASVPSWTAKNPRQQRIRN